MPIMKDVGYTVKTHENSFTVRISPRCIEIMRLDV